MVFVSKAWYYAVVWFTVPDVWYKACDEHQAKPQFYCTDLIRVDNHGEDQNADILYIKKNNMSVYFGTSTEAGRSINIVMTCFKKLNNKTNIPYCHFADNLVYLIMNINDVNIGKFVDFISSLDFGLYLCKIDKKVH